MNQAMNPLRDRTKKYALRVIRLAQSLSNDKVSRVISNQLLRSGTSVGANYRAACRATAGGNDIANPYGSAGNDLFTTTSNIGRLTGTNYCGQSNSSKRTSASIKGAPTWPNSRAS